MNLRHQVEIGETAEALLELATQADAQPAASAAAAAAAAYTAAVPTDWAGTPPATMKAAIDRLAAVVKALNAGTGA